MYIPRMVCQAQNGIVTHSVEGKALSIIAARPARAVHFMLKRNRGFDKEKFFNR